MTLDAYAIAYTAHHGDFRKIQGEEFFTHPYAVADIAAQHMNPHGNPSAEEVEYAHVVGILHDMLDMKRSRENFPFGEVSRRFKPEHTRGVLAVSMTLEPLGWHGQRWEYLGRTHREREPRIQVMRSADKIHNLDRATVELDLVGPEFWSRFKGGRQGYIWWPGAVYAAIKKTHLIDDNDILDRFAQSIDDFSQMVKKIDEAA